MDTESEVGREGPRRGGPSQKGSLRLTLRKSVRGEREGKTRT